MNIKEKLIKIKALARSGIDGEKTTAQKLLNSLLGKYKISLSDIETEVKKDFTFKLKNHNETILFHHCVLKYFGDDLQIYETAKLIKIVELTKTEYILLLDFFNFHRNQYQKEISKMKDKILFAYVNKHDLFSDGYETYTISEDIINNFQTVVKMLDDVSYYKTLK